MSDCSDIVVILNYRESGRYALNVLAGALETDARLRDIDVQFPRREDDLVRAVAAARARGQRALVGWSFYSRQFADIKAALARLRARTPEADVIHLAGGVHATAEPQQTLAAGFDLVAVGEGERTLVDLVHGLRTRADPGTVRGIASRVDGQYVSNGRGAYVALDDYPPCAPRLKRFGPIEITRGCIYGCRFCQTPFMNKARFRHRSVENICYYAGLMRAHGYTDYRFITPTALSYGSDDEQVNLDAVEALLAGLRGVVGRQGRIFFGTFPSEVRPEHLTPAVLALLKRYVDNDNLIIGGQSGSQSVLDAVRRGHTVEAVVDAVRLAAGAGFRPNVDLLFGLPGETAEDAAATRRLAQTLTDLGARIHAHAFMPLPGTPFRDQQVGTLDPETRRQVTEFTAQGKAYGQWRVQADTANELTAPRVPPGRRGG